ncbi:hypothetical protein C2E23DRAFT_901801 [Lenzites betulinus]|nr:hypothetical protein C2E23DRAFT_901801 [Lenzites betulinus]
MSLPSKKTKTEIVSSAISPKDTHPKVDVVIPRRVFLEDVSLDILLEVFSHLHPQDLLLMSRTSKIFRAFLMSRRSALVWKEARVRTSSDAPPCPPHMSEPQYAVLLFTQRRDADAQETSAITAWGKKQAPLYARMKKEHIDAIGARIVELKRALEAHLASLGPRNAASDTRAHLVLRPACRQLLEAPTSQEVTSDDFLGILDALEEEWHEEREREFEALVSERYPGLPADGPPVLSLAISNFDCSSCRREYLRWPAVLAHRCARSSGACGPDPSRWPESDHVLDALRSALRPLDLALPWGSGLGGGYRGRLGFRVMHGSESASVSARACGYDLSRVTFAAMQRRRFYCTICTIPNVKRGLIRAYDWQEECARCERKIFEGHTLDQWAVLDDAHTAAVLAAEAALEAAGDVPEAVYGCTHCPHHCQGARAFRDHCMKAHGIEQPPEGLNKGDFYLHPESPTAAHHTIVIYPEYARGERVADKAVKDGRAVFSSTLFVQ